MPEITVKFTTSVVDLPIPKYQTEGSAGCDIHASEDEFVPSGARMLIKTGLSIEIPPGYECQIRPRSSLALKHGIVVLNAPSTIDSDYRGELHILLINHGTRDFKITKGDRIAQLVFAPVTKASFVKVDALSESDRGEGGWGSTGR